jgi:hypothetical protein
MEHHPMAYLSKALNVLKDSFIWQADLVEDHPWWALGFIWVLGVLALV